MSALLMLIAHFELFVLVLFRTAGVFLAAPALSSTVVPRTVKVLACAAVSACLLPVAAQSHGAASLPTSWLGFGLAGAAELLVGVSLGFFAFLAFTAVQVAGELLSEQLGFSMSTETDPTTETEMTVLSQLATVMALLLFMALNGHHWLLGAVAESYGRVPVGTFGLRDATMEGIVAGFVRMFESGVVLAAPVLCATLLTTVAVGIVARLVPQINAMMMAFPLRIAVGLVMLGAALPFMAHAAERQFAAMARDLLPLLGGS